MVNKDYSIENIDKALKTKKDHFVNNIESNMLYKSNYLGDILDFQWLEEIEKVCPNIDTIVRIPKVALIREEEVVKMEKSKKVTVETIKDLARHTNYINKYDKEKNEIEPSKVLNVFNEETYNIYENRFLYTLIDCISRFVDKKEKELKNLSLNDNKFIEYKGLSETTDERINIELKITSEVIKTNNINDDLKKQIKEVFKRIKRVKEYVSSWCKSPMYMELERKHVHLIQPPIKKTNVILKNPNFQLAVALWDYLRKFDYEDNDILKKNLNQDKNELQGFIDHSFFIDFCVLDSICKTKREQKKKISDYAILLLTEEIRRVVALLQNNGFNISDDELLSLMSKELKNKGNVRLVGMEDVKNKFKSAMDEYLERTQDYL